MPEAVDAMLSHETCGTLSPLRGSTGSMEWVQRATMRAQGSLSFLASECFVQMSAVREMTSIEVIDDVGSSPCMGARMSENISDVFMTMTSFTDVLS